MLQGYTMAIVPCGNLTPKKLPTGGGEWPAFRTARAQRAHSARYAPKVSKLPLARPGPGMAMVAPMSPHSVPIP